MDRIKSLELEGKIKGTTIGGFKVLKLINNGKSAAVFKAEKNGEFFALKIFDNELIERFGHEIQTRRIEQEIALKDHTISNLVKIYEGGDTKANDQTFYFIVMEFIEGENLKDYIKNNIYGQEFILNTLKKLIDTTEKLLTEKQIAHRDIKPENIMVRTDGEIILMDLGVLKLIGKPSDSDAEVTSFVGTLRYAPPEFLLRTEEDSINGWRSINIYQIGATLHDLIMRQELFSEVNPYTKLVIAIKDDAPLISNNELSYAIIQLTRNMTTKNWERRLELVTIEKINKVLELIGKIETPVEVGIDSILTMQLETKARFDDLDKLKRNKDEIIKRKLEIGNNLCRVIEGIFDNIMIEGICNNLGKSQNFALNGFKDKTDFLIQNYLYELKGDLKIGYPCNLFIWVRISNDETNYSEIEIFGFFPSPLITNITRDPLNFFKELARENDRMTRLNALSFIKPKKTINIFKGIVEFDVQFTQHLSEQIIILIHKALNAVRTNVEDEIQWLEKTANSKEKMTMRVTRGHQTLIFDTL